MLYWLMLKGFIGLRSMLFAAARVNMAPEEPGKSDGFWVRDATFKAFIGWALVGVVAELLLTYFLVASGMCYAVGDQVATLKTKHRRPKSASSILRDPWWMIPVQTIHGIS